MTDVPAILENHAAACEARRRRPIPSYDALHRRMRFDRWASVEHRLARPPDVGFADADRRFKDHRFAVLVARRAG